MRTTYILPVGDKVQHRQAVAWLSIAVGFLLASGIYPLLLALARTTYDMPWKDLFYTALVMHVDFTVLWWLLGIAGVFFSLNSTSRLPQGGWLAMLLVILGGFFAAVSPLTGDANPLTNNYVPMLENRYFIKGLIVFGGGVLLMVLRALFATPVLSMWRNDAEAAVRFGIFTAAVAAAIALAAIAVSYAIIPGLPGGREYYEALFWAGGHVLQFTHTALMLVAWLWLASVCGARLPVTPRIIMILFALGAAAVLFTPWPFISYGMTDPQFSVWFVWLMRDANSIAAVPIAAAVIWGLLQGRGVPAENRHLRDALLFSILLFAIGGVLGVFIGESSTLITAHYHGSIVAVTMAFMAMTYHWLPVFGFSRPNLRLAAWQIWTYAIGQLIHIIGLAWGGGHGMKRKVVGTTQELDIHALVTPQDLVGIGGVIAVVSGILFAAVVLPILFKGRGRGISQAGKEEKQS